MSKLVTVCRTMLLASVLLWHLAATIAAEEVQKIEPTKAAICGTWVVQQVSSHEELERLTRKVIGPALETPHLRGLCIRVPWHAIDEDFSLLEAGLKLARERKLSYSVRFMAGRHTPARVFAAGSPFYEHRGEKVPTPFHADGTPNDVFEREYDRFLSRLADWCRQNNVRLLHLAWYGQDWAELNHGKEVRSQPGYTYQNWLRAHLRLIDIGLKHANEDLAVELPFSGYGPLTQAAVTFTDHVIDKLGPNDPRFFCQANGWGPQGDWGAPTQETERAFDKVWEKPICRGQQAIQPSDYDWRAMYDLLRANGATYCEVYATSFTLKRRDQLAAEIERFAEECKDSAAD